MCNSNLHSFVRAHLRVGKRYNGCGVYRHCFDQSAYSISLLFVIFVTLCPRRKGLKQRGTAGGGGSDEGEQGSLKGEGTGDAALEAAAAAALQAPSPSLPPASLKLMLLNNTTCRVVIEGKISAVPSAAGERQSCIDSTSTTNTIALPADALCQLDVAAAAGAVPAATADAVLYNAALALMQGGGHGHAAAFKLLARCSHVLVSPWRPTLHCTTLHCRVPAPRAVILL